MPWVAEWEVGVEAPLFSDAHAAESPGAGPRVCGPSAGGPSRHPGVGGRISATTGVRAARILRSDRALQPAAPAPGSGKTSLSSCSACCAGIGWWNISSLLRNTSCVAATISAVLKSPKPGCAATMAQSWPKNTRRSTRLRCAASCSGEGLSTSRCSSSQRLSRFTLRLHSSALAGKSLTSRSNKIGRDSESSVEATVLMNFTLPEIPRSGKASLAPATTTGFQTWLS